MCSASSAPEQSFALSTGPVFSSSGVCIQKDKEKTIRKRQAKQHTLNSNTIRSASVCRKTTHTSQHSNPKLAQRVFVIRVPAVGQHLLVCTHITHSTEGPSHPRRRRQRRVGVDGKPSSYRSHIAIQLTPPAAVFSHQQFPSRVCVCECVRCVATSRRPRFGNRVCRGD